MTLDIAGERAAMDAVLTAPAPPAPFYLPVGNEIEVFEAAWRRRLAIMLKGPTGCGKTRFVEFMAHRLKLPLYAIAGHEDISAADLVGRYLLQGGDTVWVDGPLTRAVVEGGICYLDEIVEARQDTTVVIHPLADHRRELNIERRGVARIKADPAFCLVLSYNPGYQSVLKDLKPSTRQRLVGIEFTFPSPDLEEKILMHETGIDVATARSLVQLGQVIRRARHDGFAEVSSTRVLVAAAGLVAEGLSPRAAAIAAIAAPLTDDPQKTEKLLAVVDAYLKQDTD